MKFTAVVLTGGPLRQEKTIQALNALNSQTHLNVEKILISNGRTENEIADLYLIGALNLEWKVVRFPVNTYIRGDLGSVWRLPGAAALMTATGEYIFFQSDDDFLSADFFSRMNLLFSKYPDALTGFGLPVSWIYETGETLLPDLGALEKRPSCESGRDLLNKYLADNSYHPNPGFSLVCRTDRVRELRDSIFENGFPDYNPLFQLAVQGPTVFDVNAHMFWGRHSEQIHFEWNRRNIASGIYNKSYREVLEINLKVLNTALPDSYKEQRAITTVFRKEVASNSFYALVEKLSTTLRTLGRKNQAIRKETVAQDFAYFQHLQNIAKSPRHTFILFLKAAMASLRRRI